MGLFPLPKCQPWHKTQQSPEEQAADLLGRLQFLICNIRVKPNALGYSGLFLDDKNDAHKKKVKRTEVFPLLLCSCLYHFTSDRRQLSKNLFSPKFCVPVVPLCSQRGKSLTQSSCTVRKICKQNSIPGAPTTIQAWISSTKEHFSRLFQQIQQGG